MSMWDFDEEGNQDQQYRDSYASHTGRADYHGSYGGHHSHSDHSHHSHGHGHSHSEHDNSYLHHGQRSEGSPSPRNYGTRHDYYDHNHQSHNHQSYSNQRRDHGHESHVSPSYSFSNAQSPATQSAHHGGGHPSYDVSAGFEVLQDHHAPPPPPTGHGHEIASRDLFASGSVVNLTLDEIDALARTHRSRSWLVVLYAPWCCFCQAMEPNFERVAHHLEQSNVYVGRFRADGDYKEYAKRYLQLEHFPTILFFPKDSSHIVKYQSENREVDALLGFVHAFE